MSRLAFSSLILAMTVSQAGAQSFPGNVPAGLAGDWSCGDLRVYMTKLGSIEVLGDGYSEGLIDARDGTLEIKWDDGKRATWTYSLGSGRELVLDDGAGKMLDCIPRD